MHVIENIETFVVDAGWRPWQFVAVRTESGITGYGEMSDGRNPFGIVGAVDDFRPILQGKSAVEVETRYWEMYRMARQSTGGIAAKAIAGIELALWDIRAKSLNIPVYALFGGPIRDKQQVYWSHCGTSRARSHELIPGAAPLHSFDDVRALGREVSEKGFTALKTNIVFPGDPASVHFDGFGGGSGTTDQNISREMLQHTERYIGALSQGAGENVRIALDLNFNFKPEAAIRVCRIMEQFDPMWVEIDMYDPSALADVRRKTTCTITSGENLFGIRGYRPFFEAHSMDVVKIDIPWNGFARSRDVALLAESYELNIAPHNYYSHLATMIGLNLCAISPNVRIMETDIDDVEWKDRLTDGVPDLSNGEMAMPDRPGWGLNLDEAVARKHKWEHGKYPGYMGSESESVK